jgi:hypothetical protein
MERKVQQAYSASSGQAFIPPSVTFRMTNRQSYCEMIICDVLDMLSARLGMNGIPNGNV